MLVFFVQLIGNYRISVSIGIICECRLSSIVDGDDETRLIIGHYVPSLAVGNQVRVAQVGESALETECYPVLGM